MRRGLLQGGRWIEVPHSTSLSISSVPQRHVGDRLARAEALPGATAGCSGNGVRVAWPQQMAWDGLKAPAGMKRARVGVPFADNNGTGCGSNRPQLRHTGLPTLTPSRLTSLLSSRLASLLPTPPRSHTTTSACAGATTTTSPISTSSQWATIAGTGIPRPLGGRGRL